MLNFYPSILYKINEFDFLKVKDINLSIRITNFINSYKNLSFLPYIVKNGERPESVSYKLYGSSKFDYIILLLNDVKNIYDDWPMGDQVFAEYIETKYGSINASKSSNHLLYFTGENLQTTYSVWISLVDSKKYTKTAYEFESDKNIAKSFINYIPYDKVIKFEVELQEIIAKFREVKEIV